MILSLQNARDVAGREWSQAMKADLARELARRLLTQARNSKEAQAVYREANAAGVGDAVARKVRMGSAFA